MVSLRSAPEIISRHKLHSRIQLGEVSLRDLVIFDESRLVAD